MSALRLCLRTIYIHGKTIQNYEGRRYIKRWVGPVQRVMTKRKQQFPQPETKRSTFLEWNREAELYAFNSRLSEKFDLEILNQAFIHRSYILQEAQNQRELGIENPVIDLTDNEVLIEKGSEITAKVVHNYLTQSFPQLSEDGIWAFHDYLMSDSVLANVSKNLGTTDIILAEEHPPSEKTMAKTFFSLIGALAECSDPTHAGIFVRDFLLVALASKDLAEIWVPPNPFETLNDTLIKENKAPAEPRLISRVGQNTVVPVYQVGIYSNKEFLGAGFGQTIAEAKEAAAVNILFKKYGLSDFSQPIQFDKVINIS